MNPQSSSGWPPTPTGTAPPNTESGQGPQRQLGAFGPTQPQPSPTQTNGHTIMHQSGPFFSGQSNGHGISNSQTVPQAPLQSGRPPIPPQQQHSPPQAQQHLVQAPGYQLPTLGTAIQQHHSPQAGMHERELEAERMREHQNLQALLERQRYDQETEILQREQQIRDQQQREQHQSPRENHAGAIPLQQPIASRVPATLHGPNGILNDQHPVGAGPQPPVPLGAPSGPANVFAGGSQGPSENALRPIVQQVTQAVPQQGLLGFTNAVAPQQLPNGVAALSQGQQPILNDALTYLDQVKVRFVHQPDVYNQFLDIMKDFKSQAIDTPGVIDRVSSLFAGHPQLIQGFNTFLPPGYRIECGTDQDPNTIRVTTPMGTTVSQMPSVHNRINGGINGIAAMERPGIFQDGQQVNGDWQASQQEDDVRQAANRAYSGPDGMSQYERDEQDAAMLAHRQQEQGVSHLSNAVSAVATNSAQGRQVLAAVSPGEGPVSLGQAAAGLSNAALGSGIQIGAERRGPVEFNHAIGYVNKIKNRFQSKPDIYKQFLEILQTYQKESKPIQDVYAQVTQLFGTAPDLLEDFKQFLPESAAQAKAQAAAKQASDEAVMLSNVRDGYVGSAHAAQAHTPRPESKLPPIGNFAPPSATKDNKKRRGGPGSHMTGGAAVPDASGPSNQGNRNAGGKGNANKRPRVEQVKPAVPEVPPVSPSLVPALPTPIPPTKDTGSAPEAMGFFERVKKYLADKKVFNEFLKLCNLFTQGFIDKNILMHRVHNFIGGNNDIMNYFRDFIQYDGRDEVIENKPRVPGDKVVLSNCRGLGPSYRMLPKRERLRKCSGRDQLCNAVLNDEWVSHPTWASEDSGFIAHRKNTHEESLHRIEEERHDYDINIEACQRTIQLIEPIVQQLQIMTDAERRAYRLPPGIGGQSETIYQRVIKKIYGREQGQMVINEMFDRPSPVLLTLLARLRQKAEEWKAGQREWEKVWREQTNKIFWKSLDHQGINAAKADKRQYQQKVLVTDIQVKEVEQKRRGLNPRYQFKYEFSDVDVIYDACHIIMTYMNYPWVGTDADKGRLETFIKVFVPTFFDIDRDVLEAKLSDVYDENQSNEELEEEAPNVDDSSTGRGRRSGNANAGRKGNLLRTALDRGRHGQKDESEVESKENTPDVSNDEDISGSTVTPTEEPPRVDEAEHRWMSYPTNGNKAVDVNLPFERDDFHLYANLNIYCFFRLFAMLYERLSNIKSHERSVQETIERLSLDKPAYHLGLVDKKASDYFQDVSPSTNYYRQVLTMCEDQLKGEIDNVQLEETLRRFYNESAYLLYGFDKLVAALLRFAGAILGGSDSKDKTIDIINLFYKDRKEDETTHKAELTYRKQVEKLAKDGDLFRIRYTRSTKTAAVRIFKREDKTYSPDELATDARWSYYISTYAMRDVTEGIPLRKMRLPYLKRNIPPPLADEEEYASTYGSPPQWNDDSLTIRIAPNNYHILYDVDTSEWWVHNNRIRKRGLGAIEEARKERKEKFQGAFGKTGTLMLQRDGGEVDPESTDFEAWIKNGPPDSKRQSAASGSANDGDEIMGGT